MTTSTPTRYSFVYHCPACKICGVVFYSMGDSINDITKRIRSNHLEQSAECKQSEFELLAESEET